MDGSYESWRLAKFHKLQKISLRIFFKQYAVLENQVSLTTRTYFNTIFSSLLSTVYMSC